MSSWWRKVAEAKGINPKLITGRGNWKRIVALGLSVPTTNLRGSWPRIIAQLPTAVRQDDGSWTRRIVPTTDHTGSPWSRNLHDTGGPF